MADKDILGLTAITPRLDGTEDIHIVQGVNSRKATTLDIVNIGSPIKPVSATAYTALAADRGKYIRFTAVTAITFTIDNSLHDPGDEISFEQAAAGVITLTNGAGVTIASRGSLFDSNGLNAVGTLKCVTASTFTAIGDLV